MRAARVEGPAVALVFALVFNLTAHRFTVSVEPRVMSKRSITYFCLTLLIYSSALTQTHNSKTLFPDQFIIGRHKSVTSYFPASVPLNREARPDQCPSHQDL